VVLLRNKEQEYNNPLASFSSCLCWQRSELRTCAKRVEASRSRLSPRSVTRGAQGGRNPLNFVSPPWKNVLDIVLKYRT